MTSRSLPWYRSTVSMEILLKAGIANADKCLEVTAHFKELSELQKIMAKRAGDRVVLRDIQ